MRAGGRRGCGAGRPGGWLSGQASLPTVILVTSDTPYHPPSDRYASVSRPQSHKGAPVALNYGSNSPADGPESATASVGWSIPSELEKAEACQGPVTQSLASLFHSTVSSPLVSQYRLRRSEDHNNLRGSFSLNGAYLSHASMKKP